MTRCPKKDRAPSTTRSMDGVGDLAPRVVFTTSRPPLHRGGCTSPSGGRSGRPAAACEGPSGHPVDPVHNLATPEPCCAGRPRRCRLRLARASSRPVALEPAAGVGCGPAGLVRSHVELGAAVSGVGGPQVQGRHAVELAVGEMLLQHPGGDHFRQAGVSDGARRVRDDSVAVVIPEGGRRDHLLRALDAMTSPLRRMTTKPSSPFLSRVSMVSSALSSPGIDVVSVEPRSGVSIGELPSDQSAMSVIAPDRSTGGDLLAGRDVGRRGDVRQEVDLGDATAHEPLLGGTQGGCSLSGDPSPRRTEARPQQVARLRPEGQSVPFGRTSMQGPPR